MSSSTAVARQESGAVASPIKGFQAALEARRRIYQGLLPKHVNVERFIRGTILAVAKEPKLLSCSQESLFTAVSQACQLGLDPSGTLGSAYILPYKGTAQFVPGYRGLIDLARRSGQILSIEAYVVREGDSFRYRLGDDPKIEHEPDLDAVTPGKMRFVYAVARLKGEGVQRDVMTRAEVEAVRKKSPAGNFGPWKDHYDEMARKTVIRRLFKYLPVSAELQTAIELDDRAEGQPTGDELLAAFEQGGGNGSGRSEALEAQLDAQDDREPGQD